MSSYLQGMQASHPQFNLQLLLLWRNIVPVLFGSFHCFVLKALHLTFKRLLSKLVQAFVFKILHQLGESLVNA